MPSKTKEWLIEQYPNLQLEELASLSSDIDKYVAEEQWEQLLEALELRQRCLETLSATTADSGRESLKSLAHSIIEQDAVLIEQIQVQQKILEKEILAFDKGRQAARAYDSI
jgi:anion-transporting  ArsA/GET3 family ATPase